MAGINYELSDQEFEALAEQVAQRVAELVRPMILTALAQIGRSAATSTAAPAGSAAPSQGFQGTRKPSCDTCGNGMKWKDGSNGHAGRFWCNTQGCRGKALAA